MGCPDGAGYTIKEIMVFMGHADVQTVQLYIKLLPPRDERNPGDRLDAYLGASDV